MKGGFRKAGKWMWSALSLPLSNAQMYKIEHREGTSERRGFGFPPGKESAVSYSSMRPNDASFLSNVIALHRAALTTASVSAPDSHELEIVKAVFANAIPNITRKI